MNTNELNLKQVSECKILHRWVYYQIIKYPNLNEFVVFMFSVFLLNFEIVRVFASLSSCSK